MTRVAVPPHMLRWALERSGVPEEELEQRDQLKKLPEWLAEERQPTLKQLEAFARATHTPIGYLFLKEPPHEEVPIPDFRTMRGEQVTRPSPDLLDTIYLCQQRQEWYREYARTVGEETRSFVGSVGRNDNVIETAELIRTALGFTMEQRRKWTTWEDALRGFIQQAEELGVLVMVSGVVGSNNRRPLNPDEFRGFALVDTLAPLVFINGADTKSAQMFTLAHELVHLWLGETGLSDVEARSNPTQQVERWCNRVAAELLVPLALVREHYREDSTLRDELDHLRRRFKVSTLVILRRLHDAGHISRQELWSAYDAELERLRKINASKDKQGNYYNTAPARVGRRFARAVVTSTLEGQTLYRDAFQLLGCRKVSTFQEIGHRVGIDA